MAYYKKDPFPKTVNDACRIMAGWKIYMAIISTSTLRRTRMIRKRTSHVKMWKKWALLKEEQTLKMSNKKRLKFSGSE